MTEDEKKGFRRSVIDRQLRKLCLSRDSLPNNLSHWQSFIQKIESTYKQYEEERYTVARSLELTSLEMKELYEKLKESSQQQLKMERDKLQAIISSLGDGLALLSDDGCVLFINLQGCELLGQSSINISGSNFFDFFDISTEKVLNVNNTIKEKGSISFETELITKSSRLPVHLTVTSFSAQSPATKALVVVFRDISFQLAARKTMEVERDLATRASALKSDFLASMSHEIRTPINGIISLVELLEYSELNEEQKQDVATIKDCADSLKSLITNVLDLSKIEAGKIFLDPVDTGLKPFVDRIIGKFRGSSSKKNIKIRFATSGDIPISIKVDSYRLDQVISNLLSNAIKFSPEHSLISVTVQLASSETGKKALLFSVQDQGDGIPASKLETIFDAYNQAGQSQVDKQSGTGLGLSICLKLVELMGGRIWAESILGQGSKFCFTISYLDVESTESAADFSRNDELDIFNNNSEGNILLVEDNTVNRDTISRLLKKKGYNVFNASNGEEAIEQVLNNNFNIVLMDLHMPVMSGLDAIKKIRSLDSSVRAVPIIALTADVIVDTREKCISLGANDYISKPIDYNQLFSAIERLLRSSPTLHVTS